METFVDNWLKRNKLLVDIIAIVLYVILQTGCFKFIGWNSTYGGWVNNILSYTFLVYLLIGNRTNEACHFRTIVMLLMFVPFFSILNSWLIYSQSPYRSFTVLLGQFVWVIYFLLHKYKVSEQAILKVFLCLALCIVAIQIIQQFTYPDAPFGTLRKDAMLEKQIIESAEQRNGLWRFRMHQNGYYTAPILFAMWIWVRNKVNPKLIVLIGLLLVSIYLTLTRQVMFACILTIFCSMFMGQRNINFAALIFGLIFIAGLYFYYDVLFSKLAQQTQAESTEDNIRMVAASLLWDESLKTPFTFLFGYGLPDGSSQYGAYMNKLTTVYGIYTTDVGFIGQIFERGLIYVCICYYMFYQMFFKLKAVIPAYVRMFVLYAGVMSVMIFPCITPAQNIVWVLLLYICDLHINNSPLAMKSN